MVSCDNRGYPSQRYIYTSDGENGCSTTNRTEVNRVYIQPSYEQDCNPTYYRRPFGDNPYLRAYRQRDYYDYDYNRNYSYYDRDYRGYDNYRGSSYDYGYDSYRGRNNSYYREPSRYSSRSYERQSHQDNYRPQQYSEPRQQHQAPPRPTPKQEDCPDGYYRPNGR